MVDKMIESRKRVDLALSALSTVKTSTVYWLYPNSNSIFYPNVEYTYLYSTWNDMKRSHPYKSIYIQNEQKIKTHPPQPNIPTLFEFALSLWNINIFIKYINKNVDLEWRVNMSAKIEEIMEKCIQYYYSIFIPFFFEIHMLYWCRMRDLQNLLLMVKNIGCNAVWWCDSRLSLLCFFLCN